MSLFTNKILVTDWCKSNHMIITWEKFQAITIDNYKVNCQKLKLIINNQEIKTVETSGNSGNRGNKNMWKFRAQQ